MNDLAVALDVLEDLKNELHVNKSVEHEVMHAVLANLAVRVGNLESWLAKQAQAAEDSQVVSTKADK